MYSGEYQYVSDGIVAEHIQENLEDLIHEYGVDIGEWIVSNLTSIRAHLNVSFLGTLPRIWTNMYCL